MLAPGGSVTITSPGQATAAPQSLTLNPGDTATVTGGTAAPFNWYLVAGICPGGLPPNNCANPVQMTVDTPRTWRRGDYGNTTDVNGIYQAVDAVASASGQTAIFDWDFARSSGAVGPNGEDWSKPTFTPSRGDGGETYIVYPNGMISAPATQDGGTPGVQYFCGVAQGGTGWVDGSTTPPTGSWASGDAWLSETPDPANCPMPLNFAFTRWRHEVLPVGFTYWDAANQTHVAKFDPIDCIISEHYSGMDIASATAMEQGVWCKNWGRVWFAAFSSVLPAGSSSANVMAAYAPWPKPPERPDMNELGSRLFTNVVLTPGGTPESAFGWPPAGVAP